MPFTRLRFHIVFATKNRERWIDPKTEEFLYPVLIRTAARYDAKISRIGGIEDHVHVICGVRPRLALSDFICKLKSESAGAVRRVLSHRKSFKWQVGYGAFTLSALDYKDARKYVDNQKEHHRRNDLWLPFETIDEDEDEPAAA